jgi:hypothetical protein
MQRLEIGEPRGQRGGTRHAADSRLRRAPPRSQRTEALS